MRNYSKIKLAARYPAAARERVRAYLRMRLKITPLLRKGETLAPPPVTVSINLTHRCNLRCRMCGQWRRQDTLRSDALSLKRLKEVITEMVPFHPKFYLWGGEPLLYPEIDELIGFLKEKDQYMVINTNGALLARHAAPIVSHRVDGLDVSIDGPPDLHDEIRGVAGTSAPLKEGLELIRKLRREGGKNNPMVKAICVISEFNMNRLRETLRLLEESGSM